MTTRFRAFLLAALSTALLVLGASAAVAQDGHPPGYIHPEVTGDYSHLESVPPIVPLGQGRFRIGAAVSVDQQARTVRFPGAVARRDGDLDTLLCAGPESPGRTLLRADVTPFEIQVALMLIDLQPGNEHEMKNGPRTERADAVTIEIVRKDDSGSRVHRVEELIETDPPGSLAPTSGWVFTGTGSSEGIVHGFACAPVIALRSEQLGVLHARATRTDTSFRARPDRLPPIGAGVEIVLRAEPREAR
jgi:hypothetical protein